jgi:competence protein ComEC
MLERQVVGVKIKNLIFPSNYFQDEKLISLVKVASKNGTQTLVIEAGEKISEEDLFVRCLQPSNTESGLEGNAGSMVLEVNLHDFSMLCTGDVEEEGEELLLSKIQGKRYDVLKVAHHGSKNSTSETLLAIVQPKIALISAGRDNGYGHPHDEVLQRLQNVKSQILCTQEKGAINLIVDGDSCKQLKNRTIIDR